MEGKSWPGFGRDAIAAVVEGVREFVFHDALAPGPLEVVHNGDVTGDLKGGEPAGQLRGIDLIYILLADVGRNSDHCAFFNRRMAGGMLYLPGRDIFAAATHAFGRSVEEEVTYGVKRAKVACVQSTLAVASGSSSNLGKITPGPFVRTTMLTLWSRYAVLGMPKDPSTPLSSTVVTFMSAADVRSAT